MAVKKIPLNLQFGIILDIVIKKDDKEQYFKICALYKE
jgi:hypothetical protein